MPREHDAVPTVIYVLTKVIRYWISLLFKDLFFHKTNKQFSIVGTHFSSHGYLTLSDSERSVLAKVLKFVPNRGSFDLFSVKADTESFFRHLRLKAHFHNQPSVPHKDVFEASNPKKSSWSPPDDQYGSLELFIRQCRHDADLLPKFRPKRPSNLTPSEFSALNSLRP